MPWHRQVKEHLREIKEQQEAAAKAAEEAAAAEATALAEAQANAAAVWTQFYDEVSGAPYWCNQTTGRK